MVIPITPSHTKRKSPALGSHEEYPLHSDHMKRPQSSRDNDEYGSDYHTT
jgi:hypothetical protein